MDQRTQEPPVLREVRAALMACRGRWRAIAAETEVPYSTIAKVAYGHTSDPGIRTVDALRGYFGIRVR
jgi:hypothetical protein